VVEAFAPRLQELRRRHKAWSRIVECDLDGLETLGRTCLFSFQSFLWSSLKDSSGAADRDGHAARILRPNLHERDAAATPRRVQLSCLQGGLVDLDEVPL
jgi:hypothetical protein